MAAFLLVRHGTTDWVDKEYLHGISDVPLNAKGRAQAADAAAALKGCGAVKMYASSLSRCMQTAAIIGESVGLEPIPTDDLVEIDFGWLEGRKIRDHDRGEYGKLVEWIDNKMFTLVRVLSGESKKHFARRILKAWDEIVAADPSGTTLIVTHSGVINTIMIHYFGRQHMNNGETYHRVSPCSITELEIDAAGRATMVRFSDNSHISEANL